jgi:hypothetical protein
MATAGSLATLGSGADGGYAGLGDEAEAPYGSLWKLVRLDDPAATR